MKLIVEIIQLIIYLIVWVTPILYWIRVTISNEKIGVFHVVIPITYLLSYMFIPSIFLLSDEGSLYNAFLFPFIAIAFTFLIKLTKYGWVRNLLSIISVIPALICAAIIIMGGGVTFSKLF